MERGVKLALRHKVLILAVLLAAGLFLVLPELDVIGFRPKNKPSPGELIEGNPIPRNIEKIPTH
ncbi:MAG TPA: hypothetical protein PL182_09355 [Pseudobdellovibrionaceae bacterium]|nr:hypothetical protein [Pseudobdellovibrionaceae bacterium]